MLGEYNKFYKDGVYACAGCDAPLYTSEAKFDSGCGWPAFYQAIEGALTLHTDSSMGMKRTEICCATCGGHIGHVFYGEGYKTPTDERHCANSISLKFAAKDAKKKSTQSTTGPTRAALWKERCAWPFFFVHLFFPFSDV